MVINSRWSMTIPNQSVLSLLFRSPTEELPTTPALIDADDPESHYLSLTTYRLYSQRIAAGLKNHGLKPEDRLLLFSGNNLYFPAVLMGTVMAGCIFTGANPTYTARELAYQLQNSEASLLLCASAAIDTAIQAAKEIGFPQSKIFAFDASPESGADAKGCKHWSRLLGSKSEGKKITWDPCETEEKANQVVALNYSSGTTGLPKGVMITHKNYCANILQAKYVYELADNWEEDLKTESWLCFLPLYHALAQTFFCVQGPLRGVPVHIMPKFDFVKMMDNIQRFKITTLQFVPPVLVAFTKHPQVKAWKWDISSVRSVGVGAAPLGREVSAEMEALWKGTDKEGVINVKQGWGMTEATCSVTGSDPNSFSTTNTVGELLPNCSARIMNDEGTAEVPNGERGELWIKAPNVMKGYWRNEKATKETLTEDGWLKTGDICVADKDNQLFIVDRKKELIKVKGNQVAPAELEALLLDHPAVMDAAVIGVPFEGDEAPRAYVVLKPGTKPTAKDIQDFVAKNVSKTKRLTGGVRFTDAIPKNPSGKILRKFLREQAAKESGAKL